MTRAERIAKQQRPRTCLKCGRRFWSECAGHRRCERCDRDMPQISRLFEP